MAPPAINSLCIVVDETPDGATIHGGKRRPDARKPPRPSHRDGLRDCRSTGRRRGAGQWRGQRGDDVANVATSSQASTRWRALPHSVGRCRLGCGRGPQSAGRGAWIVR